jgi:broad specificity phosphatase PhoE
MSQTIWIARHGNRIDFVNPQWFDTAKRPYDPHLSDDGIVQAQQLAKRLQRESRITRIFASPFLRTVQTANEVAEVLDLPIKLDWGLCEWLNPEWMSAMPETLSRETLARDYPRVDLSYSSDNPVYPETWDACIERSSKTCRRLADNYREEEILLVGHGASVIGTAMGLVGTVDGSEIKAALCCLVKIVRKEGKWVMELKGDTSHLGETESAIRFN